MWSPRPRLLGLSLVLLVSCGGCGRTPPVETSTTEANVKGTVLVKGKPPTGGEVSFDPSNIKRPNEPPRSVPIGKDGTYSVTTLVGDNRVRVSFPGMQADRALSDADLTFEVKPGENQYDIALPPTNP